MKKGQVIYLKSQSKSFSWNDGLFVINSQVDDSIELLKLKEDGTIKYYDDNTPVKCICSIRNPGIILTQLTYNL